MQGWISESWPKVVVGLQASFAAPTACHSHCFRSGGKVPLSPLPSSSHTWGTPFPTLGSACPSPNHPLAWGPFLPFMNEFLQSSTL